MTAQRHLIDKSDTQCCWMGKNASWRCELPATTHHLIQNPATVPIGGDIETTHMCAGHSVRLAARTDVNTYGSHPFDAVCRLPESGWHTFPDGTSECHINRDAFDVAEIAAIETTTALAAAGR